MTHGFVDERAMITTTLISACHWKTLVPFWLRKKRPESEFLILTVNYHKIVQKNKLYQTTVNWLFDDIRISKFLGDQNKYIISVILLSLHFLNSFKIKLYVKKQIDLNPRPIHIR